MASATLHLAPWIIPVSGPVLADGAVAVGAGKILAVGTVADLGSRFPGARLREHPRSALMPALVNAHVHLELSHLALASHRKTVSGFTGWIAALLAAREKHGAAGPEAERAARLAMLDQHRQGVIALGDIGNTDIGALLAEEFPGLILHFHELLGRSARSRRTAAARLARAPAQKRFTAHAPYSTHPELITMIKERARRLDHPFPIHAAEPRSENELLCSGSGELHDFLLERGFVDASHPPPAAFDKPGSVRYLHRLRVLDAKTVCVHCIHVSQGEVQMLSETRAKVCLCPGSNRYLGVGRAPVRLFLDHSILPGLGTDSLASNPQLSMWREMRCLREDHPGISPADIVAMATLGGATALGLEQSLGTLEPGKTSSFLSVRVPDRTATPAALLEALVEKGPLQQPAWIEEA